MKARGAWGREMGCTKAGGMSMGAEGAWMLGVRRGIGGHRVCTASGGERGGA